MVRVEDYSLELLLDHPLWHSDSRMEKSLQDLRFAFRVYAKNRSFTTIAVLALAIGIGANIAVFTVINALLFRPAAVSAKIPREVSAVDASVIASTPRPLVEMLSGLTAQQKIYATLTSPACDQS